MELSDAQIARIEAIVKDSLSTSVEYGYRKALEGRGSSWTTPWPGYHQYHLKWTMDKIMKTVIVFTEQGSGI